MFSTMLSPVLMLLLTTSLVKADFSCSVGGDLVCAASCFTMGQSSGICDGAGECVCSEQIIRSEVVKQPCIF